jgi:hypothetical protein
MEQWGVAEIDGVTVICNHLGFGPHPKTLVFRIAAAPEGHEMAPMIEDNIFAFRAGVQFESDPPTDGTVVAISEKSVKAATFRSWLRKHLKDEGFVFKTVDKTVESSAPQATDSDDEGRAAELAASTKSATA